MTKTIALAAIATAILASPLAQAEDVDPQGRAKLKIMDTSKLKSPLANLNDSRAPAARAAYVNESREEGEGIAADSGAPAPRTVTPNQ